MVFKDINVIIVIRNFNQKEDLVNYKKSSLKVMFIKDKYGATP